MSFLDRLFVQGVAAALKTPSNVIAVDGTEPFPGAVLTAVDATHASWLAAGGGGSTMLSKVLLGSGPFTLDVNTRHIVSSADITLDLPDALEFPGTRIDVLITEGGCSVTVPSGEPQTNTFWFPYQRAQTSDRYTRLTPGLYSFLSVSDQVNYPDAAFWIVELTPGVFGRRSLDVDYAPAGKLPDNAIFIPIGVGPRQLVVPQAGNQNLPRDGDIPLAAGSTYPVGARILINFDDVAPAGVYVVNRHNDADDWELELVELATLEGSMVGEQSDTEYIVRGGSMMRDRRFRPGRALDGHYALDRTPLKTYPIAGIDHGSDQPLEGAEQLGVLTNGYGTGDLLMGCINRIGTSIPSTPRTFSIVWPTEIPDLINGERFAVILSAGAGGEITINPGDAFTQISAPPDGLTGGGGTPITMFCNPGTYAEWVFDASARFWRLAAYIPGVGG